MYGSLNINLTFTEKISGNGYLTRLAAHLFASEYARSMFQGWLARLTGRNMHMLDLQTTRRQNPAANRAYLGTRAVPIDRIRGSESRCDDFDVNLRPRREHVRGRWVNVAVARLTRTTLPPVELIFIGGFYFIRDGHHRISVARALGEKYVDAIVLAG